MLEVEVRKRRGDFSVELTFETSATGVTALFGRSGAGKTSLIDMIAGLLTPDDGRIVLDGEVLFDSRAGINLRPERRRVGYVFQEPRLFPHQTVRGNLEYGARRAARGAQIAPFDQVVGVLGIGGLLDRRPHNLSGGERQRVAIGRALLAGPRILLMDEPLASLDAARKGEILDFIDDTRRAFPIPIVYVSHAMEEVVRLADMLVLISEGHVAATGTVEALMSRLDLRPLTGRYEAGAVMTATVSGTADEYGLSSLAFPGGVLRVPRVDAPDGTEVRLRIRARDVSLALEPPQHVSILNIFRGTVTELGDAIDGPEDRGAQIDVRLDIGVPLWARITRRSAHDLGLAHGREVYALVKAVAIDRQSLGLRGASHRDEP